MFLRAEWPDLATEAESAERNAAADPRTACFYARRCLEQTLKWLYRADRTLRKPYQRNLNAMIAEPSMQSLVGTGLHTKMEIIRRLGNRAVHESRPVSDRDALSVVGELFHVTYWLARHYTRGPDAVPPSALAFDTALVPRPTAPHPHTRAELKALADQLAAKDKALAEAEEQNTSLDEQIAKLQEQIAAAKAANQARPDDHDYNEAQTRDLFVDLMLREAGWPVEQDRYREVKVTGMPNGEGVGWVDYVLWGDDGKPLAVVEAKRTRVDPITGQHQAKLYADCLEAEFGQRPVIYCTNGYQTRFWDDLTYPPREVQGFHTKDELQLLVWRRTARRSLAAEPVNAAIVERHYQVRAIRRIAETFEDERQRRALLVMATGAGKTRTVIALVDLLMRTNWVKRVLFLADRLALVTQAVAAFKTHLPDAVTVNLVTERDTDGRVYVSTYPTVMNLINETAREVRRFGPGHFDLIVIDEAHRSVYRKYGAIFDYFDGLLVGLTATPKDEVDRNTYRLFSLESGVPTDAYGLDEAIADGYLVPPRAVTVPLRFQHQGIRYDELSDEDKERWDELEWGDDGEVPDQVPAEALNRWLFNDDTVDKALEVLMDRGHRVAGGDRIGKTIIFAANRDHANFIAKRFGVRYPQHGGGFATVIYHGISYAQNLIDNFSRPEKEPHIAISVDMLDTGIDVPEVVNLVFFKKVRSKTKFWQMIGRGTRLRPDLYAPGVNKQDFFIFDLCGNFEYFNQNPETTEGSLAPSLTERIFKARVELVTRLDERLPAGTTSGLDATAGDEQDTPDIEDTASEAVVRRAVARQLHDAVRHMDLNNFVVRPRRDLVEYFVRPESWHRLTPEAAAELSEGLAGLPTAAAIGDDETAKRFDLMILRLQLGTLQPDPRFARTRADVQALVAALLEQTSIPVIREQEELLDQVAGDEWWADVTLPMLESLRRRVRGLVKLIEKSERAVVYTDFEDQLGEITEHRLGGGDVGTDLVRFREKVQIYLRTHQNHVAVQKLRRNRQLSATDVTELERMLAESGVGGTRELEQAQRAANGLGLFIRSLVGLDRQAATEAFSEFLVGRQLSGDQVDFIKLIINYLTENGVLEAGRLYEQPFTDNAPYGPESKFASADVARLIEIIHSITATAKPSAEVA